MHMAVYETRNITCTCTCCTCIYSVHVCDIDHHRVMILIPVPLLSWRRQRNWYDLFYIIVHLCVHVHGHAVHKCTCTCTYHSSQGWAPQCPIHLCLHVCTVRVWCIRSGFPFCSSSTRNLASVLCTSIFMYLKVHACVQCTGTCVCTWIPTNAHEI